MVGSLGFAHTCMGQFSDSAHMCSTTPHRCTKQNGAPKIGRGGIGLVLGAKRSPAQLGRVAHASKA
eukprot:6460097-Amphidinium_carterae.1